jgi:hypothetical protein
LKKSKSKKSEEDYEKNKEQKKKKHRMPLLMEKIKMATTKAVLYVEDEAAERVEEEDADEGVADEGAEMAGVAGAEDGGEVQEITMTTRVMGVVVTMMVKMAKMELWWLKDIPTKRMHLFSKIHLKSYPNPKLLRHSLN